MRMGVNRLVAAASLFALSVSAVAQEPLSYPQTRKADHVDTYHGVQVADPYRWLEDDNSPETAAWVEAQNKVTFGYLDRIPYRRAIATRLRTLNDYERYSAPSRKAQALASHDTPLLIRIETNSAHGASGLDKQLDTAADIYSFIMFNLGATPVVPGAQTAPSGASRH